MSFQTDNQLKDSLKKQEKNPNKILTFFQVNFAEAGLKNLAIFSGGNLLAQITMMVYAILVARFLGPVKLGIYSGLYAILGITITLVNFGLDLWMLNEAHSQESIRILTGKVVQIKLTIGFFWIIGCLVILPVIRPEAFTFTLVFLAVFDVLADVLFNTLVTSWNTQGKIKQINIFLLTSRTGKLILLCILSSLDRLTISSVIFSRFIVSLIILIGATAIIRPVLSKKNISEFPAILKSASKFGYSEILAMIYANVHVAILSFFSFIDTGLYSPASGIIHALFIIPNSAHVYLLPRFAKQMSATEGKDYRRLAQKAFVFFTLIGSALTLGVLLTGRFVATTFLGSSFEESGNLLMILSPILLFKSVSFGFALLIIIMNQQKKRLLPQLIVAILAIFLNLIFIPRFGVTSVAWIYVFGEFLLVLGYFLIIWRNRRKYE